MQRACGVAASTHRTFPPPAVAAVIQAATITQNAKDLQAAIAKKVAESVYTDGLKVGWTLWWQDMQGT